MGIINAINTEVEIFENTEEEDIKDMEVTIKEIRMTIREEEVTDTILEGGTEIILTEVRIQIIAITNVDNLSTLSVSICILI